MVVSRFVAGSRVLILDDAVFRIDNRNTLPPSLLAGAQRGAVKRNFGIDQIAIAFAWGTGT
jgi:hypothetical protein